MKNPGCGIYGRFLRPVGFIALKECACSALQPISSPGLGINQGLTPRNARAVGALVERTSRLAVLVKLSGFKPASAANVSHSFMDKLLGVVQPVRLSMAYGQGREMAMHKRLIEPTGIAACFCDAHSPWQRGSNENMHLVRQCLSKETNLSIYRQEPNAFADEINNRSRKGLGVRSPLAVCRELRVDSPQHFALITKPGGCTPLLNLPSHCRQFKE